MFVLKAQFSELTSAQRPRLELSRSGHCRPTGFVDWRLSADYVVLQGCRNQLAVALVYGIAEEWWATTNHLPALLRNTNVNLAGLGTT